MKDGEKPHKRVAQKPRYNNRYIEFFEVAPCNGIRNPESREIVMLESGIQDIFYVGIRNPVSWNPESTKVLESRIYLCRIVLVDSSIFLPSHLLAVYLWLFYTCDTRNTCSNLSTQDTPLPGGIFSSWRQLQSTCDKKDARRFARWRFQVLASEVFLKCIKSNQVVFNFTSVMGKHKSKEDRYVYRSLALRYCEILFIWLIEAVIRNTCRISEDKKNPKRKPVLTSKLKWLLDRSRVWFLRVFIRTKQKVVEAEIRSKMKLQKLEDLLILEFLDISAEETLLTLRETFL